VPHSQVDLLLGNPSKAKKVFGWECKIKFNVRDSRQCLPAHSAPFFRSLAQDLVKEMVLADIDMVKNGKEHL